MLGLKGPKNLYVLSLNSRISTRTMIFWPQPLLRCVNNYHYIQNIIDELLTNSEDSLENSLIINEHIR